MPRDHRPLLRQSFGDLSNIGASKQHQAPQNGNPGRLLQGVKESRVEYRNRGVDGLLARWRRFVHERLYVRTNAQVNNRQY